MNPLNTQREQLEKLFIKVVEAVHFVHSKLVTHGDIKLSNIMIDSPQRLRLIDFGYATSLSSETDLVTNYSGTPVYLSPEILRKKPFNGESN